MVRTCSYLWSKQLATINPLLYRVTMTYDLAGRWVRMADGNNHLVTFLFDALNRDAGSIDPLARRVTLAYDPVNNLIVQQRPTKSHTIAVVPHCANSRMGVRSS